jgi:hypothetical protein
MVLIQLLLPTALPPDAAASSVEEAWATTRAELVGTFEGLTAYVRAPARGVWTAPDGHREGDDVVMVEVVTTAFDRGWWRQYAATLARRFGQQEIHVRAMTIGTLDDEAEG